MPMTGEENERREEKKRERVIKLVSQWDILKGSGRAKVAKT